MEFTVSKADLVRELNLSQGVVEKKTTIPILSNVLLEADGDRIVLTATDLELGIRCSCAGAREERGCGHDSGAEACWIMCACCRMRDVKVKFADNHWANLMCGRSKTRIAGMSRESFPELPADAGAAGGNSDRRVGSHDRENSICDLDGRIAIHAEWSVAGLAQRRLGDGGDRWPSPGDGRKRRRTCRGRRERIARCCRERPWANCRSWRRRRPGGNGAILRRRKSSVLQAGRPVADQPQTDRQLSRTTSACCRRISRIR